MAGTEVADAHRSAAEMAAEAAALAAAVVQY
jgi:hypothetical protein